MAKQIIAIDDIHAAGGTEERADVTRMIGLDGEWRELDLTQAHDKELREALGKWWEHARKPGGPPLPEHSPGDGGRESRQFWKGFRDWCDRQEPPRSYLTSTGKFYYRRGDVADYRVHLGEQAGA